MTSMNLDQDAIIAAADLVGRTGAREFQIGWDCPHTPDAPDDHGCPDVTWYAHAQLKGARITVEKQPGPVEAANALAHRILDGAKCYHCGKLVALSDTGAMAYNSTLSDGTRWTVEEARAAGQCRWRRMGPRWQRGCEPGVTPPSEPTSRQQRRAAQRRDRKQRRPS